MGAKQRAKMTDCARKRMACWAPFDALNQANIAIQQLNLQIIATTGGHANSNSPLQAQKNPLFLVLLKQKPLLKKAVADLKISIASLDKFIEKKKKRWKPESTLQDAINYQVAVKHYLKVYEDAISLADTL